MKIRGEDTLLERNVSSSLSFFTAIGFAITVILQYNLIVLSVQTVIAFLLALVARRKGRMTGILIVMVTTVFLNMIFPQQYGAVMFSVAGFSVYRESLFSGLQHSLTIGCLFFLSKALIRPDLKLPGRVGRIMSESLGFLSLFLNEKWTPGKNMISRLDSMLFVVQDKKPSAERAVPGSRTTVMGLAVVGSLLALNVIFLILKIR